MSETNGVILLYVPCGSDVEALRLVRALLEERLVACGNLHETRSLYFWKGEMADEKEYVLICKTTASRAEAAARRVLELHTYDIPCVLRIELAAANHEYAAWVRGEVVGGLRVSREDAAAATARNGVEA